MSLTVEFFGIPRERTGVASVEIDAATLGAALEQLGLRFPRFRETCLEGAGLRSGFIANVNGRRFTTDPATILIPGDSILILSADAGG